MSFFKFFNKKPKVEESAEYNIEQLSMTRIVLRNQAETILKIINNPKEYNCITHKKLYDYWLNSTYTCYSNTSFQITDNNHGYDKFSYTPETLATYVLSCLEPNSSNIDLVGLSLSVSSAMDAICTKYSEMTELCKYLTENNLRVRKV